MRRMFLPVVAAVLLVPPLLSAAEPPAAAPSAGKVAAKPLYRDPVHDGPTDPVVIWNPHAKRWWMFYTSRRANVPGLTGVTWVHGTSIGIAESADGGATWNHAGTADIEVPAEIASDEPTLWAPEVFTSPDGKHHMFLTVVPGVFNDWNHPRTIVHLTSDDLRHWSHAVPFHLSSERVIDACVLQLPDGTWRMWYNNEADGKSIYFADSPDLKNWTDKGKAAGTSERGGEGPKVFRWKGSYWMAVDVWDGLRMYRSDDALHWQLQQHHLLQKPGTGPDDQDVGRHPDVIVNQDRAYLFYFTHPGRGGDGKPKEGTETRRSSIQVTELHLKDGRLTCDRNQPTTIHLAAPRG